MVISELRIGCFSIMFMDIADVYPECLCRTICLITVDEYHQLAIGTTGFAQIRVIRKILLPTHKIVALVFINHD